MQVCHQQPGIDRKITLFDARRGQSGDKPIVGDFGNSRLAVFRPTEGRWYFHGSFLGHRTVDWGELGDIPITANFDWDSQSDIGVFRPSTGQWFLIKSRFGDFQISTWGEPGDIPVPGIYNQIGRAELVVYRPSNNRWYFAGFGPQTYENFTRSVAFGEPGDIPAAAAYNY